MVSLPGVDDAHDWPAVSVIMPIYNAGWFLRPQLDSILSQMYPPLELLLVDDGSSDESPAIAQEYAELHPIVRFQRNETNQGLLATVNGAIQQLDGDLIALSDHDDVWLPDKLARQVAYLVAHPEVSCVFADRVIIGPQGHELCASEYTRIGTPPELADTAFLLASMAQYTHANTLIFRAELTDHIFPIPCGWDWWIGAVASWFGPVAFLREPVVRYRVYEGSVSSHQQFYVRDGRSRTTRAQVQVNVRLLFEYAAALYEHAQRLVQLPGCDPPLSLIQHWRDWYGTLEELLRSPTWRAYRRAWALLPTVNRERHLLTATLYALPPVHKAYLGLASWLRGY